ncbi:hypothetical protein AS189_12595 [Arthrobacter alpinus]|uniref:Transcriptional regulator LacI/GalR-like sensor domain-containing protein n=2 Tax=Arthrobacter alpinus TaxID=656366 RepID=A0A0S2M0E8_9MICC|nr:hypothetical protein AS189_12595 [Arthrobacter alpinus]
MSPGSTKPLPKDPGGPTIKPVGLVLLRSAQPGQLDSYHQEFIRGVESRLAQAGRSLLVMLQADPQKEIATYRRWAQQGGIAGVILMNLRQDDDRVPLLQELGLPAVVIGDPAISDVYPAAFTDDRAAMVEALRYLMALGHQRIGRIAGPPELLHTLQRTEVYTQMMAASGGAGCQRNGEYSFDSGKALTAELFAEVGGASASSVAGSYAGGNAGSTTGSTIEATQPTAIIYDDAVMAMGGLAALAELGLAVPDQVSVLAWDDSVQCQLAGVSALSHDVAAYGELAAELLLSHVAQTAQPAGESAVSCAAEVPTLVKRCSTGPVPS